VTQLETDVRVWMHERAARVHASPRLLAADYHPRTRLIPSRLAIGGALAAAAAALAALLSLAGTASTAFAGWTPQPTTPTKAQLAAAKAYCARNVPDQGLPLKLIDARGPFTILVYSNGGSNDFCTVGPSFHNASGWSTSPPVTPPAGRLFLWTDHTSTDGDQPYGSMIASAGSGVSAAKVTLGDGSVVTATVENGFAVAWWPGTEHLASAQLTTPSGVQTQTFRTYPCDVYNCKGGGSHGGAPSGGPGGG
jgi:hypothetical protein